MRHHILRILAAFVVSAAILAVGGALSWVTYHLTAANVALAAAFVVLAVVTALSLAALLWLILAPPLGLLDPPEECPHGLDVEYCPECCYEDR